MFKILKKKIHEIWLDWLSVKKLSQKNQIDVNN